MRRYRLNTTISLKHHEILQKYTEKYGTQRSVLEQALVNNSECIPDKGVIDCSTQRSC